MRHARLLALLSPLSLGISVGIALPAAAQDTMMTASKALLLFAVIATSLLQPIVQPPVVYWLLGITLELPLGLLMARLALFVGAGFGLEHPLWFQKPGLEPVEDVTFYRFPGENHELSRSGSPLHRVQRGIADQRLGPVHRLHCHVDEIHRRRTQKPCDKQVGRVTI